MLAAAQNTSDLVTRLRDGDGEVDLRGADLRGADLSGMDLSGRDLTGADLTGATLHRTDLAGVSLNEATLDGAILAGASLKDADLTQCSAQRAALSGADLTRATLFGVDLTGGSLTMSKLTGTDLRCAQLAGCNLTGAHLDGADLSGADLADAILCDAIVSRSIWRGTSIHGVDFRGVHGGGTADWVGVRHIAHADFGGAMLLRRHILDTVYVDEFRERFPVVYWVWWVSSDCGRSLVRWGAWTVVIATFYAVAYAIVGVDWGSSPTWFSPMYFSIVTLTSLGYGDVLPNTVAGQVLATSQAVVGYVMLGGLISILSNKLARRAD